ncbi:cytidylyltransferase domain-containing protein [Coleofasciculus sp. G2-EDA-02]|uniref:cytidylyltransferase domain-containing protein n=1 Tax=Coleofasciculus sp. G2-EDA-02 TaxID=3069529 RepID=UPI0032F5FC14
MKIVAIIQARMGSTRLPGKVMRQLSDKTVLAHVIQRVQACSLVKQVIVATTTSTADDVIISESVKCGVNWFRGSEDNVLERYYLAAKEYKANVVVRVTSDCPLFDTELLTQMLNDFKRKTGQGMKIDYLSNTLNRSYPYGLDAEIFTFAALEQAFREARQPYEKEHVTPYIYQHPNLFSLHKQVGEKDLSAFRWTLDTEEDWRLISKIYSYCYKKSKMFTTDEILHILEINPELAKINAHVKQKSLQS